MEITEYGLIVPTDRCEAISKMKRPINLKQTHAFIGIAQYFRKILPNLSKIASPLNALTKKGVKFHWGPEQDQAFQSIKKYLLFQT